jgi:hypothetical protein
MSPMRKAFCCAACDEPIWEALSVWTSGPLKDEIRDARRPLPGAKRLTVALGWSGNRANISLCKDCELTADNVVAVWDKILERDFRERDFGFRRACNPTNCGEPPTPEQREWSDKMQRVMHMERPLLVLSSESLGGMDG